MFIRASPYYHQFESNSATISVSDPAAPVISQIYPSSLGASSANTRLTITGSNFQQSVACSAVCGTPCPGASVVELDHRELATQVLSSTELQASVSRDLLFQPRSVDLAVKNPVQIQCQPSEDQTRFSAFTQFPIVP